MTACWCQHCFSDQGIHPESQHPPAFHPPPARAHPPDDSNLAAIRRAAEYWRQNGDAATVPADYASKLSLMTDYLRDERYSRKYNQVPDREWAAALGVAGTVAVAAVGLTSWCSQCQPEQTAGNRSHPPPLCVVFALPGQHPPLALAAAYYGGASGFELVLDLLDDACQGLLDRANGGGGQR